MADYHISDSDSDDEFLMFVAQHGRNARKFRERPDHLTLWNNREFFIRFRLSKPTVLMLLELVEDDLETITDRYGLRLYTIAFIRCFMPVYIKSLTHLAPKSILGLVCRRKYRPKLRA
jgi:hypothetical protein